jgi:hypothetical protein
LIPEGNVLLEDAGGGDGGVIETLIEEGSFSLAGCLRERQSHCIIVAASSSSADVR